MFEGMYGSNRLTGSTSANTDDALRRAAQRTETVGTASPINGFFPATKSDVEGAKQRLKQRREQSVCFRQLLAINLKHQEVDIVDTKALVSWRTATDRNLKKKGVLLARGAARQEILAARFTQTLKGIQEDTKDKVQQIQSTNARARERVKNRG